MSRRYRNYSSRRSSNNGNPLGLLVLLAFFLFLKHWKAIVAIALIAVAGLLLWRYLKNKKQNQLPEGADVPALSNEQPTAPVVSEKPEYTSKASLMTDCEKEFFTIIKKLVEPKYIVQPQVNLASIIDKESHSRYRNELFRNIDFGVFTSDYTLKVLIEINDSTHLEHNRRERDQKVKNICEEAGIPLITLWTKYGINETYIRDRLAEHLSLDNQSSPVDAELPKEEV